MSLFLSFLGTFRVTLDDQPAAFATDRARALLAYLAVEATRPHRREALADLLWPDRPESTARQNLSQSLTRLRRAIDDYHADPPFLFITPKSIQFNASAAGLDVARFVDLLRTCTTHPHPSLENCRPCADRLEQAVSLYRGDFLGGLSLADSLPFEEWALFKREQLHRQAVQALNTLALHHEAKHTYYEAQRFAERQLVLEPWREEAHRQLMRALALSGQRSAALAQYHACCQVLAEELGVEPMGETTVLYEQIRAGEIRAPASVLKRVPPAAPAPLRPPPALVAQPYTPPASRSAAVFVGRERELARLHGFLSLAQAGRGRVVFVSGEAGTGKTALSHEFARRAQEAYPDLVVARGRCNAHTGVGDPYLPFREALRLLTGDVESGWAEGTISQETAGRLSALAPISTQALLEFGPDLVDNFVPGASLPGRAIARPAVPSPGTVGNGAGRPARAEQATTHGVSSQRLVDPRRGNLFQQYTAVLQALAAHRPLLLILDDLQWVDASSIGLLFHLGRQIGDSRILLVGTYRPEDVAVGWKGEAHPLRDVIGELKRGFGDIQVRLDQTTEEEAQRFVDALLDAEPNRLDASFRRVLFQHTEGHPLFTVELLRDLQEHGELCLDAEGRWVEGPSLQWGRMPPRVEGVIERRFGRLAPDVRQALRVACVEGEEFTAEVVASVQKVDKEPFIRRLSAIAVRQHGLVAPPSLRWLGTQHLSRYRFRHYLFQTYLYQTLDEAERVLLHEAVGTALEGLYGDQVDQVAVQLAQHFQAAGNVDKAIDYLRQAGERACRLSANEEAVGHFRQGLALLRNLPDSSERAQRELALLLSLGNALIASQGSESAEVVQTFRRARELCLELGDRPELLPVLNGLHH